MCVIGGCTGQDSPETRFDDYLARLARTLDTPRPSPSAPVARAYPDKRRLQRPVETPRTGWIGLFELHRCGLVNLVSERNSILGRVAPAHQRLAYESQLLAGLTRCRKELSAEAATADPDFVDRLDTLIARKRDAVPRIFWNRTLGGDAVIHVFSLAGRPPGLTPTASGRATRQAIGALASAGDALARGDRLDADTLAGFYRTLEASTYGGQLQIAAIRAIQSLDSATAMLTERMARRPICFNQRPNRRGRTLQTILLEVYGPEVQSYLADLVRAGHQWRAAVDRLVDAQRTPVPASFRTYWQATLATDSGLWPRLNTAIEDHTRQWQTLLGDCGLMPGS
ncbi:hypothetical protein T31B1_01135 [Salinisphaera sp. T31B1]